MRALWLCLFALGCAHRVLPQSDDSLASQVGTVLIAADESGERVRLRIDAVERDPEDPEKEIYLYSLSVEDEANHWQPYCLPDRHNVAKAIPLSGSWDRSGRFLPDESVTTFACTGGVLAKCVRWGYKPWKSVHGVSLRDYHQTCTRMARADYCGDGHSHTREGTEIDLFDILGIQKRTPHSVMRFEAAWSPMGATFLHRARWFEPLDSLVAECPERLRDRASGTEPAPTVDAILKRWPETLLFNESIDRSSAP